MTDRWITIKEAARLLGKSKRTIWRKIEAGELQTLQEPGRAGKAPRMVSREDILRLKEGNQDLPAPLLPDLEAAIRNVTMDVTGQIMSQAAGELVTKVAQAQKRSLRFYLLIAGVIAAALVTLAAYYVTRRDVTTDKNLRGYVTAMSHSQKQAQEATREALEADLAAARGQIAALEAAGRADREEIRAGEEATLAEIRGLRAIIEAQGEKIAELAGREPAVVPASPSPGPEPERTPAERSRFLGLF